MVCLRVKTVNPLALRSGVVVFLSCWIVIVFGFVRAEGADWKLYHTSGEEFYFYDAENVIQSKDVTKVSEKSVVRMIKRHTVKEALKEIGEIEKKNLSGRTSGSNEKTLEAMALQETARLYEIRCAKKMCRVVSGMEYDKEGTLIDGILTSQWDCIKPDSVVEKLYKAVCP